METPPNPFEAMRIEYENEVNRAYEEGGPEAAALAMMRGSIKMARAYAAMGMKTEALEDLEIVCDAAAADDTFEGVQIFNEANDYWKELRDK